MIAREGDIGIISVQSWLGVVSTLGQTINPLTSKPAETGQT